MFAVLFLLFYGFLMGSGIFSESVVDGLWVERGILRCRKKL
jgi:hypothetical protein